MVSLSQENIDLIRESLNTVSDTINESIEEQIKNPEKEQEDKEKVKEENIVDKNKGSLSSGEKKRFTSIAKIFIDSWMKSIQKIKKIQEKRSALAIKKEQKEPGWLKRFFTSKKEKEPKPDAKCKEGASWWKKLLALFVILGGIYYLFKDRIKIILPKLWAAVKKIGGIIFDLCGKILSAIWAEIKELTLSLWDWIKENLSLEKIGEYISAAWDKLSEFFNSIWSWLKSTFSTFIDNMLYLPNKIFSWISEAVIDVLSPIFDALKEAWEWIKEKVLAVWDWYTGVLGSIWEGIKSYWDWVTDLYSGIWNFIKDCFSWEKIKTAFSQIWDGLKALFTKEGQERIMAAFASFWNNIADWWNSKGFLPGKLTRLGPGGTMVDKKDELDEITKEYKKSKNKKPEKQSVPKLETKINKVVEQKDIKLKDNLLETVKEICERINIFFSEKSGGFIDLSEKTIEEFTKGFRKMENAVGKLKLSNAYNVENKINYDDDYSYDYSDKSSRSITHDNKKVSNNDYTISYNTLNVPALNRAISSLENKVSQEITLLRSQNDYLTKIVKNFDGFGEKVSWLDPSKLVQQATNSIIPIVSAQSSKGDYNASLVKSVQNSFAKALN